MNEYAKSLVKTLNEYKEYLKADSSQHNVQHVGHLLCELAVSHKKYTDIVEDNLSEQYVSDVAYERLDEKHVMLELDEDTGDTHLVSINTLNNVIDDSIDDLKDC